MDSCMVEGRKPRFLTKMVVIGGSLLLGVSVRALTDAPLSGPGTLTRLALGMPARILQRSARRSSIANPAVSSGHTCGGPSPGTIRSAPWVRYLRLRAKTCPNRPKTGQKPAQNLPTNQNIRFRADISVVGADIGTMRIIKLSQCDPN